MNEDRGTGAEEALAMVAVSGTMLFFGVLVASALGVNAKGVLPPLVIKEIKEEV